VKVCPIPPTRKWLLNSVVSACSPGQSLTYGLYASWRRVILVDRAELANLMMETQTCNVARLRIGGGGTRLDGIAYLTVAAGLTGEQREHLQLYLGSSGSTHRSGMSPYLRYTLRCRIVRSRAAGHRCTGFAGLFKLVSRCVSVVAAS